MFKKMEYGARGLQEGVKNTGRQYEAESRDIVKTFTAGRAYEGKSQVKRLFQDREGY